MKKSSLNQGALVELRNGGIYILIGKIFVHLESGGFMPLAKYEEDLRIESNTNRDFDIMKVFNPLCENYGYWDYINNKNISWDWERKKEEPSKELTVGEIEKLLGYKVKIIKEESK